VADPITLTIPGAVVQAIEDIIRLAVADELAVTRQTPTGFLDVDGAATYLASTPTAIRSLVKRHGIPHHKAPNGRLLFDQEELRQWVTSSRRKA